MVAHHSASSVCLLGMNVQRLNTFCLPLDQKISLAFICIQAECVVADMLPIVCKAATFLLKMILLLFMIKLDNGEHIPTEGDSSAC